MNARLIYNKAVKFAQSNRDYYIFGKPSQVGVIEDLLSYFGLDYEIIPHSQSMHENSLKTLRDFMLNTASDEQLKLIEDIACEKVDVPKINPMVDSSEKVFVSMPMNKEKCSLVDVIRDGVKQGIEKSGNDPYFLDQDVHNEYITVKMLDEINSCKFLVADLTSQNTGVYFEAGYAKALGKTVIFACQKDDFGAVHFDIKQIQMIIWDNKDDLVEKLFNQIVRSGLGEKQSADD